MTDTVTVYVAEISQNYINGNAQELEGAPTGLSRRFELVIAKNQERGFQLADWRMNSVHYVVRSRAFDEEIHHLNETIVAVFEKRDD